LFGPVFFPQTEPRSGVFVIHHPLGHSPDRHKIRAEIFGQFLRSIFHGVGAVPPLHGRTLSSLSSQYVTATCIALYKPPTPGHSESLLPLLALLFCGLLLGILSDGRSPVDRSGGAQCFLNNKSRGTAYDSSLPCSLSFRCGRHMERGCFSPFPMLFLVSSYPTSGPQPF